MKTLSAACIGLVSAGLLCASGAYASDGTITITGQVTDSSCNIAVNGATGDATIVLPTVSTTVLASDGDTAGSTSMNMALTGCPTAAGGLVRAYFESANVDVGTGNLKNTATGTPATNVQVQVTNATGAVIDLATNDNNTSVDMSTGDANLQYFVQYYATGASTAGPVETALVYSLDYQ